jgi:hypothetical protein
MTKLHSSLDVAVEIVRDLEEFNRSGSRDGVPKVPGTAATCPLRQHFMVESTFGVVWSDPGLGHKRTCRPPQVADSFFESAYCGPDLARVHAAAVCHRGEKIVCGWPHCM